MFYLEYDCFRRNTFVFTLSAQLRNINIQSMTKYWPTYTMPRQTGDILKFRELVRNFNMSLRTTRLRIQDFSEGRQPIICTIFDENGTKMKAFGPRGGARPSVVPSAESVPAPRFEPGTSDSKAKMIPLHKRVWPESAEESPPSLHSSPFWREETCVGWFHLPQCCGLYTILFCFKQACIYTTEDTIVCDEICIHTNKLQHGFFLDILVTNCSAQCQVSSGSEIRTRDLRFQGEDDTTTQKGLTRKCGRITSVTTLALPPPPAMNPPLPLLLQTQQGHKNRWVVFHYHINEGIQLSINRYFQQETH